MNFGAWWVTFAFDMLSYILHDMQSPIQYGEDSSLPPLWPTVFKKSESSIFLFIKKILIKIDYAN